MSLQRRPVWRRFLRTSSRVATVLMVGIPIFVATAGAVGIGALVYGMPITGDLEGMVPKPRPAPKAEPSEVVIAKPDGTEEKIAEFREFDLTLPMKPEDVPQVLKDAVVASEDHNFWQHVGVDPQGLARAALANFQQGETVQGGSTMTQQLVRSRYLTTERTVERKFNEVLLSTRFERELVNKIAEERNIDHDQAEIQAKEQILYEYLNTVYFGAGAYGAAAAAETYFHKNVRDLNISEAALLASIIPAPSKYGPRENLAVADQRRKDVLQEMRDLGETCKGELNDVQKVSCRGGYIKTDEELTMWLDQSLWYAAFGDPPKPSTVVYPPPPVSVAKYPYYVDYIRVYMLEKYGPDLLYRGGLKIYAAIDPRLQELADQAVGVALAGTSSPLEMSLVSVEPPTGLVKALVGGRDWNASQVNLALGGSLGMQPGSAIKAFTVAKALEEGYSPETQYFSPGVFYVAGCNGKCGIRGGTGSTITMRYATANSTNTYFAQLVLDVGPNNMAELAHRVGVTRLTPNRQYTLGVTLGADEVSPLDMAAGFSVFANHGVKPGVTPVATLLDSEDQVIEDNTAPHGKRVLNAAVADWTTDLLTGVVQNGTGRNAAIGRPVAGKTGTAQAYRAAWFVGYTPQLATAVWMGYSDKPRPLPGSIVGGQTPALTFSRFMRPAHEGLPVMSFAVPGILPPPSSGVRHVPDDAGVPDMPLDCNGPCVATPTLTSPTTLPLDPACDEKENGEPVADNGGGICVDGHIETTTTRPRTGAPTTTMKPPKTTKGSP